MRFNPGRAFMVLTLGLMPLACRDGRIVDPFETPRSRWFLIDKAPYQVLRHPDQYDERILQDANGDRIADTQVLLAPDGRILQAEMDTDFDGRVDRWEYYRRDGTILKIGESQRPDGRPDVWVYPDPRGGSAQIDVDRDGDGRADMFTYFESGRIVRRALDTDDDGLPDRELPVPVAPR